MKGRFRLILRHWIDSLLVSVIAGVAALTLRFYVTERAGSLVDGLAGRPYLIPAIAGFTMLLLAIICPARVVASLKSIRLFPRHVGICLRAMIGILVIVVADLVVFGTDSYYRVDAGTAWWAAGALVIATALGYPCSTWLAGAGHPRRQSDRSPGDELQSEDSWLTGDEAIGTIADNLFPEHESVAKRILTKLLSERNRRSWLVPSLALLGPYGSGKTSICNLVEDDYLRRAEKEKLPRMLFCRFEAWQFLSPEAATAGLVRAVTERVLEVTDELSLWRVPGHYVEAMQECGGRWGKLLVPLLGGSDDPRRALFRIGDTLARLDLRVVVFVDDFDRIEGDSPATQQAVAKALNQFQGMPNLQYVITVGPTSGYGREAAERHVSWDLLKLTRYQELVPRLETRYLVELTKKWRDHAQKDQDYSYPWAYISENESDPLTFHPEFELIYSRIGLIGNLVDLVNTPRACKAMLRETVKTWELGLKGEIDWYDLLL